MIFLAALRDCAKPIDNSLANRIQTMDICIQQRDGTTINRIRPGETTLEYFEKYIQKVDTDILASAPKAKEHKRIKDNYKFFLEKITNALDGIESKSNKRDYMEGLRKKIDHLIVIDIRIEREEDAYEIFETTNARGVDLNVGDLVKNLVFKNMKASGDKDTAKGIWQNIVDNVQVTNTELRRFIRYFWISRHPFVTEKKLYKAIKNEVTDWDDFLGDLWNASEYYNTLLQGSEDSWKNLKIKHYQEIYQSIFVRSVQWGFLSAMFS